MGPFYSTKEFQEVSKWYKNVFRMFQDITEIDKFPKCEPFKHCEQEILAFCLSQNERSILACNMHVQNLRCDVLLQSIGGATHLHFILLLLVVGAVWFIFFKVRTRKPAKKSRLILQTARQSYTLEDLMSTHNSPTSLNNGKR